MTTVAHRIYMVRSKQVGLEHKPLSFFCLFLFQVVHFLLSVTVVLMRLNVLD